MEHQTFADVKLIEEIIGNLQILNLIVLQNVSMWLRKDIFFPVFIPLRPIQNRMF